jgi:peptide/nickel transport system substrate-binding protein
MKRLSSILLVASSLLWSVTGLAAERPHYGGTLHIELRESPRSLDPAMLSATAPESLSRLVFETLVVMDENGCPKPLLATSWQAEPGNQRWRFLLRSGVSFSDGTPVDAAAVVASLRNSSTEWKVLPDGNSVIIETENSDPDIPAELALVHRAVVRRDGNLVGTGPFTIAQWTAGQHLNLKANDAYRGGRPFLDSIDVEFNKNDRDQMMALDLGKADVAQVAPENIHRTQAQNRTVLASDPSELIALAFPTEPRSDDEIHARNLLALSIDTATLNNVVLQGGGEPTAALLPTWASGYGFIFGSENAANDRRFLSAQRKNHTWTLGFDVSDPIQCVIAQRVALNARDAGIILDLSSGAAAADLRLVRIPLASSEPHVALIELAVGLQFARPTFSNNLVAELYAAEKNLLQSHRVIPLLHVRRAVALRPAVHDFSMSPDGVWHLENIWLSAETP